MWQCVAHESKIFAFFTVHLKNCWFCNLETIFCVFGGSEKLTKEVWNVKKIIKDEKGENFYDFLPVSNVRLIWNSISEKREKIQFKFSLP